MLVIHCRESHMAGDHLEQTTNLQKLLDTTNKTLDKSGERVQALSNEVITASMKQVVLGM